MNPTVNLSFRYLESDYVRAVRAHLASRVRLRLDIVVTVALVGIGIYLWRSPDLYWLGAACVVMAFVFALILVAGFIIAPVLTFRREPKFRDESSLTFSAEGIHFRTAHIDSQLQWSLYSLALVDAHSYVLYYGSRQFTVIPKRAFLDAEEQRAFEQLLAEHVSQVIRRST